MRVNLNAKVMWAQCTSHRHILYKMHLANFKRVTQKIREEGFIERIATKNGATFVDQK